MSKKTYAALAFLAALTGASAASAIQPIEGSITYGGQPTQKLEKAPIGSVVQHQFTSNGNEYNETYVLQDDRSLKLVARTQASSN